MFKKNRWESELKHELELLNARVDLQGKNLFERNSGLLFDVLLQAIQKICHPVIADPACLIHLTYNKHYKKAKSSLKKLVSQCIRECLNEGVDFKVNIDVDTNRLKKEGNYEPNKRNKKGGGKT